MGVLLVDDASDEPSFTLHPRRRRRRPTDSGFWPCRAISTLTFPVLGLSEEKEKEKGCWCQYEFRWRRGSRGLDNGKQCPTPNPTLTKL